MRDEREPVIVHERCPYCAAAIEVPSGAAEHDALVCATCVAVLIVTDTKQVRRMTPDERRDWDAYSAAFGILARRAVREQNDLELLQ